MEGFSLYFLDDTATEKQADEINELLKQLTTNPREVDRATLKAILAQTGVYILVVGNTEGHIVAMATLAVRHLLLNTTAILGDVVVDENHRGMNLGKKMTERLIALARNHGASFISLTSNPRREAANNLYKSLGFELIGKVGESNYYRLKINHSY